MSLYKNKKVVVTGGSGFVGTHFIQELLDRGANVRTSIHKTPLKIQDDRIEVLLNDNVKVQIIKSTITSLLQKETTKK